MIYNHLRRRNGEDKEQYSLEETVKQQISITKSKLTQILSMLTKVRHTECHSYSLSSFLSTTVIPTRSQDGQ